MSIIADRTTHDSSFGMGRRLVACSHHSVTIIGVATGMVMLVPPSGDPAFTHATASTATTLLAVSNPNDGAAARIASAT